MNINTYTSIFNPHKVMIQALRSKETQGILGCPSSNKDARAGLCSFFLSANIEGEFSPETQFLMVNIFDAYLSRERVSKPKLFALAILLLASDYNEIAPSLFEVCGYTEDEIREEAKLIFIKLGCNLNIPLDIKYLDVVASKESYNLCKNLMLTCTLSVQKYLPSVIATSALWLISQVTDHQFTNPFNIPLVVVKNSAKRMVETCKWLSTSKHQDYKSLEPEEEWMQIFNRLLELTIDEVVDDDVTWKRKTYFKKDLSLTLVDQPIQLDRIGRGTYAYVYRARYNDSTYAVKVFKNATLRCSFIREVSTCLSLNHPNISTIRYISNDLRTIFYDLGECDLRDWLDETKTTTIQKINFAKQMLSALSYIHSVGCIHRDIKPPNIIVYDNERFVLADFENARCSNRNINLTSGVGTLWYKAPEMCLDVESYDNSIDVWSMLCTLYEFATGRHLFPGSSDEDQLSLIYRVLGGKDSKRSYTKNTVFFDTTSDLPLCYVRILKTSLQVEPSKRLKACEIGRMLNV